jgi:AcrR family transcriptional regulator
MCGQTRTLRSGVPALMIRDWSNNGIRGDVGPMARSMSSERKEQIMEVAARIFACKGYHRATISDIIHEADIARGTFYLYFSSKQQVFELLSNRFLESLKGGIEGIDLESDVSPLDQLQGNLARSIETVQRFRDVAAIMLGSHDAPDPVIRDKVDGFFAEVKELVATSIQTGQAMGLVRKVSPDLAARFTFGAAREVMRDMVALRPDSGEDAGEMVSLSTSLVDLVARGLFEPHVQADLYGKGG